MLFVFQKTQQIVKLLSSKDVFAENDLCLLVKGTLLASPKLNVASDAFTKFEKLARAAVPTFTSLQVEQMYILSLVFSHSHTTELVLQRLGFGSAQDTAMLIRCLEALFFLLQMGEANAQDSLLRWTETVIEAFFLQLSVFGGQQDEAELDYAMELIERI